MNNIKFLNELEKNYLFLSLISSRYNVDIYFIR